MSEVRTPPGSADRDVEAALHELGNALSVVVGFLEAARSGGADAPSASTAIDRALARAVRAHRIARRAIGADAPASPEPLAHLVDEAVRGADALASAKRVSIRRVVAPDLRDALAQAGDRLLQILTNLLLNALEVSPEGAAIELEVVRDGERARLAVTDEGPGVPAEEREGLFVRGQSGRPGGAGIGLSHAARLAREEGGSLELDPVEPDPLEPGEAPSRVVGARFVLRWPLAGVASSSRAAGDPSVTDGTAPPSSAPRTRRAPVLGGLRVLVLDDDDAIVELLDMVLGARGVEVVSARTTTELEGVVDRGPFDAALLDASPLDAASDALLERLCASSPRLHVVLISGSRDAAVPASLRPARTSWVHKPFEIAQVLDVLADRGDAPSST